MKCATLLWTGALIAFRAVAEVWYVPGWNRTAETNGLAYACCTNVFKDADCRFWGWQGNERWSKSRRNSDQAVDFLVAEIEGLALEQRENLTLVGHSLGARLVAKALSRLADRNLVIGQGILLAPAMPNSAIELKTMGRGSRRPVLLVLNSRDVTLKYVYRAFGGEKGPALGTHGPMEPLENVVEHVCPPDITNETSIERWWARSEIVKRVCNHLAVFYFKELQKARDEQRVSLISPEKRD